MLLFCMIQTCLEAAGAHLSNNSSLCVSVSLQKLQSLTVWCVLISLPFFSWEIYICMWHLSLTLLCSDEHKELLLFANGHSICWKVPSPFQIYFFPWLFSSFSVTGKGAHCYFHLDVRSCFAFWNSVRTRYCDLKQEPCEQTCFVILC